MLKSQRSLLQLDPRAGKLAAYSRKYNEDGTFEDTNLELKDCENTFDII